MAGGPRAAQRRRQTGREPRGPRAGAGGDTSLTDRALYGVRRSPAPGPGRPQGRVGRRGGALLRGGAGVGRAWAGGPGTGEGPGTLAAGRAERRRAGRTVWSLSTCVNMERAGSLEGATPRAGRREWTRGRSTRAMGERAALGRVGGPLAAGEGARGGGRRRPGRAAVSSQHRNRARRRRGAASSRGEAGRRSTHATFLPGTGRWGRAPTPKLVRPPKERKG